MKSLSLLAMIFGVCCLGPSATAPPLPEAGSPEIETVHIPAVTFYLGVDGGEFDEGPVHKVTISDFEIGKYEVTVGEYRRFITDTNREMPDKPKWGWNDTHPVVNVSWSDANAFADWLSKETGETYRLPTEAEWYFVASDGGKPFKYGWGNGVPKSNIADESAAKNGAARFWPGYDDGYPFTAPVGSFSANSLGVHDMGGNVAEWVANYHYTFSKAPQINPEGPAKGKNKVFKGGSFSTNAWYSRIAQRNFMPVTFKKDYLGFRLAKDVRESSH